MFIADRGARLPRPEKIEPGQRSASSIPPIFIKCFRSPRLICEYPMRQRRFPLTAFTRRSRVSCRCSKRGFPERPRKGSLQPPRRDFSRAPRTSRPAARIRGSRALPPNTPLFRLVYDHLQLHVSILAIPAPRQAAGASRPSARAPSGPHYARSTQESKIGSGARAPKNGEYRFRTRTKNARPVIA